MPPFGVAEPVQAASGSTPAANAGKSGHRMEASFAFLLNTFTSYAPLRGTWPGFCYLLRISQFVTVAGRHRIVYSRTSRIVSL